MDGPEHNTEGKKDLSSNKKQKRSQEEEEEEGFCASPIHVNQLYLPQEAVMYKWPLLVFLGVRVVSVPLVQTWFVPDEYWQATEVAHALAFGYGYKTWEWREGIRSVLYPASFAALFKMLSFIGADTPALLIHIPRLLHAIAFAVGDYHFWKLCKVLYGSSSAGWTMVCFSTAWFLGYCAPRTLTSCVEMVLLSVAFSWYPWQREKESDSAGYLWPVGLACAVRPTAAVPFLPLAVQHLWHSSCRSQLLLHYMAITGAVVTLTVGVDSWYYGELVVVPWRFVHFNVVTGLSSHYGTLPWHWYLSQALPVTLTTHMLPLILAVVSQTSRHRNLLFVILWSLIVYSCLGHKEFRFLLPVLPLCLCIAGDYIAFYLAACAKRSDRPLGFRRKVIFLMLLIPNLVALVYLGVIHQRGPLDTMQALREEVKGNLQANILFLMPCHSTPYYSHLHKNVTMRFLTCEPNLKGEENYLDEADVFEKDPLFWLQQEYYNRLPALQEALSTSQDGLRNLEFRDERQFDGSEILIDSNRNEEQKTILKGKKEKTYESKVGKDAIKSRTKRKNEIIEDINVKERNYGIPKTSLTTFPSHIVMFSVMKDKVEEFLSHHHYYLCHKLFHSHINDGRRSQHIHIYCQQSTTFRS